MIFHSAPKDQDCGRLEKGKTFKKDRRINHPPNVNTESHNGNNPKELTIDVRVIWTSKN
jgi:hypothetical protein